MEAGQDDYVAEPGPALLPGSAVAMRFGAHASAVRRYFRTPMPAADELVFNTSSPHASDASGGLLSDLRST